MQNTFTTIHSKKGRIYPPRMQASPPVPHYHVQQGIPISPGFSYWFSQFLKFQFSVSDVLREISAFSWPSSSRKYSATVRPVKATRARAPGGSFIWPYTNAALEYHVQVPKMHQKSSIKIDVDTHVLKCL